MERVHGKNKVRMSRRRRRWRRRKVTWWRKGNLPQSSVHSSCTPGDNLGDEDPWIIGNVGIVYSSSNAKAQARVPLHTRYDWHFQ